MARKTFTLGVLNIEYMYIVFRPSIVDFSVKSRAGAGGLGLKRACRFILI